MKMNCIPYRERSWSYSGAGNEYELYSLKRKKLERFRSKS